MNTRILIAAALLTTLAVAAPVMADDVVVLKRKVYPCQMGSVRNTNALVRLAFENVDARTLLYCLMDMTWDTIAYGADVTGRFTCKASEPLRTPEAVKAIHAALASNGYAVVSVTNVTWVVRAGSR